MPSSSKKQHNFMAAIAHSPDFAKKAGVSMSVGKEFVNADKAQKGTTMATKGKMPAFMAKMSKAEDAKDMKMKKKPTAKYARGGGIEVKGKTKGKMVTMASGGRCK
jgi:hypothetical protein